MGIFDSKKHKIIIQKSFVDRCDEAFDQVVEMTQNAKREKLGIGKNSKKIFCDNCGRKGIVVRCRHKSFWSSENCNLPLCAKCAVKCTSCGKYFCPKHGKKHKC